MEKIINEKQKKMVVVSLTDQSLVYKNFQTPFIE